MEPTDSHSADDAKERDDNINGIKDASGLAADQHGESLDPGRSIRHDVNSVVGMKDRDGYNTNRQGQHESIPMEDSGDGVSGADNRQYSENDEYVKVAESVILQE